MFVCTHILTIWTQVFYLNQTMGQQWSNDCFFEAYIIYLGIIQLAIKAIAYAYKFLLNKLTDQ